MMKVLFQFIGFLLMCVLMAPGLVVLEVLPFIFGGRTAVDWESLMSGDKDMADKNGRAFLYICAVSVLVYGSYLAFFIGCSC